MQEIQLQYMHDMCNIFYLTRQLITKISVLFIKMYIVTKLKKEALTKTPRQTYHSLSGWKSNLQLIWFYWCHKTDKIISIVQLTDRYVAQIKQLWHCGNYHARLMKVTETSFSFTSEVSSASKAEPSESFGPNACAFLWIRHQQTAPEFTWFLERNDIGM